MTGGLSSTALTAASNSCNNQHTNIDLRRKLTYCRLMCIETCDGGTGSGGVPVLQQARPEGSPGAGAGAGLPQDPPHHHPRRRSQGCQRRLGRPTGQLASVECHVPEPCFVPHSCIHLCMLLTQTDSHHCSKIWHAWRLFYGWS